MCTLLAGLAVALVPLALLRAFMGRADAPLLIGLAGILGVVAVLSVC